MIEVVAVAGIIAFVLAAGWKAYLGRHHHFWQQAILPRAPITVVTLQCIIPTCRRFRQQTLDGTVPAGELTRSEA